MPQIHPIHIVFSSIDAFILRFDQNFDPPSLLNCRAAPELARQPASDSISRSGILRELTLDPSAPLQASLLRVLRLLLLGCLLVRLVCPWPWFGRERGGHGDCSRAHFSQPVSRV